MNAVNSINILDSIIPISRFNKGEANRIFTEVKNDGIRIVVKNNTPECVLISPKDYQALIEQYEDALLLAEANNRLSKNVGYISHDDVLSDLNINEQDLENIDIEVEWSMWKIFSHPEAKQELKELDGSQQKIVLKAIIKVAQNPESNTKGGYGKPLGNKGGNNLTGLFKIKLKGLGLRIVYKLEKSDLDNIMKIIVISVREDNEVYEIAGKRESR